MLALPRDVPGPVALRARGLRHARAARRDPHPLSTDGRGRWKFNRPLLPRPLKLPKTLAMAMRCPGCRKSIPLDAVEHACGWRVSRLQEADAAILQAEREPRASREVIDANLARMRVLTHARPRVEVENDRGKRRVPIMADVGHGSVCCCELCWRARQRGAIAQANKSESRYDALAKMFPVEEVSE